jgi:hypothetical protein
MQPKNKIYIRCTTRSRNKLYLGSLPTKDGIGVLNFVNLSYKFFYAELRSNPVGT